MLASATGDLVNTATVTANNETDSVPANNTATDTDTLDAQADLSITKDDGSLTYTPGGTVTYTIVVSNAGPSDAVDASVADTFDVTRLTNINWGCVATGTADCGATATAARTSPSATWTSRGRRQLPDLHGHGGRAGERPQATWSTPRR